MSVTSADPSTPDKSFVNIPVLPPPKHSPQKSPKIPQSPNPSLPPLPSTPKSALRFPQLEPRSRSNSNTSTRSRSPSPLRKVVFSPQQEDKDVFTDRKPPKPPQHQHQPQPQDLNQPEVSSQEKTQPSQMTVANSPFPSFVTPVSVAFTMGMAVGLSISGIRPTLEKAVDYGSSWLGWLFKTVFLYTTIAAVLYLAFVLAKGVIVTLQQNQEKAQKAQKSHTSPRGDPFDGLAPSSSSTVSSSSGKSSASAASIHEFNNYLEEQKLQRRGQKDEEHSFRPYPSRPRLAPTAPGKIYGNMK